MHLIYFILQKNSIFVLKNEQVDQIQYTWLFVKKTLVFVIFAHNDFLIIVVDMCK